MTTLTFNTLWANSAEDKLIMFFFYYYYYYLFFPENSIWHFMQIVSNLLSEKNKKRKYFKMSSAEKITQSAKR